MQISRGWGRAGHSCRAGSVHNTAQVQCLKVNVTQSCLTLCNPFVAFQSPLSVGFSKQESWSGLSFPSPGNLPDPGTEPGSPALEADSLPSEPPRKPSVCRCPNLIRAAQICPRTVRFSQEVTELNYFSVILAECSIIIFNIDTFFPCYFPI